MLMLNVIVVGFTSSLITPCKILFSFMLEDSQLSLFQFDTVDMNIFSPLTEISSHSSCLARELFFMACLLFKISKLMKLPLVVVSLVA